MNILGRGGYRVSPVFTVPYVAPTLVCYQVGLCAMNCGKRKRSLDDQYSQLYASQEELDMNVDEIIHDATSRESTSSTDLDECEPPNKCSRVEPLHWCFPCTPPPPAQPVLKRQHDKVVIKPLPLTAVPSAPPYIEDCLCIDVPHPSAHIRREMTVYMPADLVGADVHRQAQIWQPHLPILYAGVHALLHRSGASFTRFIENAKHEFTPAQRKILKERIRNLAVGLIDYRLLKHALRHEPKWQKKLTLGKHFNAYKRGYVGYEKLVVSDGVVADIETYIFNANGDMMDVTTCTLALEYLEANSRDIPWGEQKLRVRAMPFRSHSEVEPVYPHLTKSRWNMVNQWDDCIHLPGVRFYDKLHVPVPTRVSPSFHFITYDIGTDLGFDAMATLVSMEEREKASLERDFAYIRDLVDAIVYHFWHDRPEYRMRARDIIVAVRLYMGLVLDLDNVCYTDQWLHHMSTACFYLVRRVANYELPRPCGYIRYPDGRKVVDYDPGFMEYRVMKHCADALQTVQPAVRNMMYYILKKYGWAIIPLDNPVDDVFDCETTVSTLVDVLHRTVKKLGSNCPEILRSMLSTLKRIPRDSSGTIDLLRGEFKGDTLQRDTFVWDIERFFLLPALVPYKADVSLDHWIGLVVGTQDQRLVYARQRVIHYVTKVCAESVGTAKQ